MMSGWEEGPQLKSPWQMYARYVQDMCKVCARCVQGVLNIICVSPLNLGDPWRPLATLGDMPENGQMDVVHILHVHVHHVYVREIA